MHVLVTGVSGFSGAHIASTLAARGFEVTAVAGKSTPRVPAAVAGLRVVIADLIQPFGLPERCDAVVHVAGRSAWPGVCVEDLVRDNVVATRSLLAYAKTAGAHTFVLFSSLSVHGTISTPTVDASTPVVNPDAYGLTKRLCELMLEADQASLRGLSLRLPGVLGRGAARNWLATSLASARAGRDITVFDPEAAFNNAVHVADLASLIAHSIEGTWRGFDILTLGAGGMTTAGEVARTLAAAGGRNSRVIRATTIRPSYTISHARAREVFGYEPMVIGAMLDRFIAEESEAPV